MDKLRSMEVLVQVADAGSFTAAGAVLRLSPAMVSRIVAELEQALGVQLVTRSTRSLALTEAGRRYTARCRAILEEVRAADGDAEREREIPRGTLRLSAPPAFGSECLAPALADYLARYPDVNVELDLSNRLVDLVEEGFDAAIRIGPLRDSSLVARPLQPYGMVLAAAPAYLARRGVPQTPADLAQHDCLEFTHWRREVQWNLDGAAGGPPLPVSRLRANHGQALVRAAVAGVGIVMQPELVLAEELAAGHLVPVLAEFAPAARPLHLVYPRDRLGGARQASLVGFLLERFGPDAANGGQAHGAR
ncbi:LysR family transcriptional regulator [Massilia arenosa]|uniref:LysR family transcriptional regulator n=1 Tax=Zemynaea arenosa TaxID=2561931 RepID=A0A4Y9SM69_9BURK|nr:LysR family transcriptional regulator [Massilia arenosa]TFW25534.1 LysR family transcriptional regulator [Massilia arenosa]